MKKKFQTTTKEHLFQNYSHPNLLKKRMPIIPLRAHKKIFQVIIPLLIILRLKKTMYLLKLALIPNKVVNKIQLLTGRL